MWYHQATFQVLGIQPRPSVEAAREVADTERRMNVQLPPPSLREWYSCSSALEILADHSNDDPPVALGDFAVLERQSLRLLPIRHENQGVCTWAVALDGSNDPPVYVEVDSDGKRWQTCARTFSAYVHACVWDYRRIHARKGLIQAQNQVLSSSALTKLKSMFSLEAMTEGWPGHTQLRFGSELVSMLILSGDDQADWFIGADDAGALESVMRSFWDVDGLGLVCYSCSALGEAVLSKLRGRIDADVEPGHS